ncbi:MULTISPECIES: alpha/beta fold hydrolase [Pseudomonas]|uniref:alpha/beta fold hydrolase n=1 Tax=Pseudomonas TaxID=286 RepID=UPI0015BD06C1|nr:MULTISPECIES: alpha/beta hydrolase [Pseudomonas]MDH4846106.1 alpha/beta hydrolase [Pseudomonas sp. BN605]MDH4858778.1 alpha/beta hydrolase [Pseudomonas sp. BN505]NWL08057.1 alpha/beta hydrolase [Pseudomonas hunanensis]
MEADATPHGLRTQYFAGSQNLRLTADVGGPINGTPVMLLHGGGQTRHSWRSAATALMARGYRVICPDCRGHGDSERSPTGDYSTDSLIADLKQILSTLSRPPVLVGASLGGSTALLMTGESDSPIAEALVLVDIVPRMSPSGIQHIRSFMQNTLAGFDSLEEAAEAVSRFIPNRPKPSSFEGLARNLNRATDGRLYWHWDPRFLQDDSRSPNPQFAQRMESAARKVKVPTLLVRGRESEVVSLAQAQALLDLIPHADLTNVSGAGHMVAGDRNDAFNNAVLRFISQALSQ